MNLKRIFTLTLVILALVACDSKKRVKAPEQGPKTSVQAEEPSGAHKVHVEEVVLANSYLYLRVTEGSDEYWIATAKQPVEAGMTLYYNSGLEMKNFTSKELNKTFDSIWFVGQMKSTSGNLELSSGSVSPYGGGNITSQRVTVEKLSGGVTVGELYASPASYEGKTIQIRAKVTKFNPNIMGRNWVHLQDGTKAGDRFDLTLTTKEIVRLGDIVVFSGKVVLNKDFGAGYKYDLIIEEAVFSVES